MIQKCVSQINREVNIPLIAENSGILRNNLLESLVELGAVDVAIVFYKFQIGVAGQIMAFEQDKPLTFKGQGILVQLIEIKDTVGDLDGKFRVFRNVMMPEIAQTTE